MAKKEEDHVLYVEIWKKTVETQMHFNEMSVKSRQLGLAFVTAALGVAVVLLSKGDDFALMFPSEENAFFVMHISALLILGSLMALKAVKTLDLNVYHKMLRGAVTFGEDFEEHYMKRIFSLEKGMTQAITHFSRIKNASVRTEKETNKYEYRGRKKFTAEEKIEGFYKAASISLWGAFIALVLVTNFQFFDQYWDFALATWDWLSSFFSEKDVVKDVVQ